MEITLGSIPRPRYPAGCMAESGDATFTDVMEDEVAPGKFLFEWRLQQDCESVVRGALRESRTETSWCREIIYD